MELITFESTAFNNIIEKIDAINRRLNQQEKTPKDTFLDNEEFIALMKISKRTAQSWRDDGIISFSQVGGKIYYRMSDIETLLIKHSFKSFKK